MICLFFGRDIESTLENAKRYPLYAISHLNSFNGVLNILTEEDHLLNEEGDTVAIFGYEEYNKEKYEEIQNYYNNGVWDFTTLNMISVIESLETDGCSEQEIHYVLEQVKTGLTYETAIKKMQEISYDGYSLEEKKIEDFLNSL